MGTNVDEIMAAAMALPRQVRAFVAEKLIESLDEPDAELSPAWLAEVDRRVREVREGVVQLLDADEVMAEILASHP
jgi:putative addiction module component (TIGR02574 family)